MIVFLLINIYNILILLFVYFLFNFFPPSHPYLKVLPLVAGTSFGRPEGLLSVAVRTSSKNQKVQIFLLYILECIRLN